MDHDAELSGEGARTWWLGVGFHGMDQVHDAGPKRPGLHPTAIGERGIIRCGGGQVPIFVGGIQAGTMSRKIPQVS